MRLWLNGTTGISKTALKVLCIDLFGEPVKVEPETAENTEPTEPEAEIETEKANAVAEAEAIANAKAEKPKHKAKRKAKEPVAVA